MNNTLFIVLVGLMSISYIFMCIIVYLIIQLNTILKEQEEKLKELDGKRYKRLKMSDFKLDSKN